jgi:hypothetical protein
VRRGADSVREQGYYSIRTGKHPNFARLDLSSLKKLFLSVEKQFNDQGFFQESFGYNCVDAGDVPGTLGEDIGGRILIALRKDNIWPLRNQIDTYSEDDLFDLIEFLFDNISKPVDGHFHSWNNCGMHYSSFNRHEGQQEFRSVLNPLLAAYEGGFTLSENGEMLTMPEEGMSQLLGANLPKFDPENIDERVQAATDRFRRHKASLEDRKHALRDLADVLEYLRPQIQTTLLSKDESYLFNIANNFGIRHHNDKQKTNYDPAIWYSWMFYYYLATIHACVRLIAKKRS